MNDKKAKKLVDEVFERICSAESTDELKAILEHPDLNRAKMDVATYPELNIGISKDEIRELKSKDILTSEGAINHNYISAEENSTLVKLMYAFLWKQGDLNKNKYDVWRSVSLRQ